MTDLTGITIAQYKILRKIAGGSMGAVYKAWDSLLNMAVAVKVMNLPVTSDSAVGRFEERFKRELRLANRGLRGEGWSLTGESSCPWATGMPSSPF